MMMIIEIHRSKQSRELGDSSGFAQHAYSFSPIAGGVDHGSGGGVYGRVATDASEVVRYEVPDGSEIAPTAGDGPMALFVPGRDVGYSASEVVAGCVGKLA